MWNTFMSCSLAIAITALMAGKAITRDIDHESRDQPRLIDPTCADLNLAYKNIRQNPRFRETIYQVKSDGALVEYMTVILSEFYTYIRYPGKTRWDRVNNDPPYWQRFTSCTNTRTKNGRRYYATYHYSGHIAGAEVWTTSDGKKLKKIVRRYPKDDEYFPFSTVVSLIDYGPKAIRPPTTYTCGGSPCRR